MLDNSAKYAINDFLASRQGPRLLIEAEYCQGVCFALTRGVDPSLYHVMGNKQETFMEAQRLGANAYQGWTREVLPTLPDNYFHTVYMDYCCSPDGNPNCRPKEEMADVARILVDGGMAMFTFCKRGRKPHAVKNAQAALKKHNFVCNKVIEYKLDGNQPMFVIFCTKWVDTIQQFWDKHTAFNDGVQEVKIPEGPPEHCEHMFMCDRCGYLLPEGGECKRSDTVIICGDCLQDTRKRKRPRAPEPRLTKRQRARKENHRQAMETFCRQAKYTSAQQAWAVFSTRHYGISFDAFENIWNAQEEFRSTLEIHAREIHHVVQVDHSGPIGIRLEQNKIVQAPKNSPFRVGYKIIRIGNQNTRRMNAYDIRDILQNTERPVMIDMVQ